MRSRLIAGGLVAVAILSSLSCDADPQAAAQARVRNWRAKDFFKDPHDVKLADAISIGDKAAIDAAIREGADVNARGKEGIPFLMWAMAKDSAAGFQALLEHGADLEAPAREAPRKRDGERVPQVIELVASARNPEFLRESLRRGFDPDYAADSYMNQSLLFQTIWANSISNAGILIDAGADIDHIDANNNTPLIQAMNINHYEMVYFLLSRGADPCIKADGYDLPGLIKEYGTRGVSEKEMPHFRKVVDELKKRNLITDADIEKANNSTPFSNREPQAADPGNP